MKEFTIIGIDAAGQFRYRWVNEPDLDKVIENNFVRPKMPRKDRFLKHQAFVIEGHLPRPVYAYGRVVEKQETNGFQLPE